VLGKERDEWDENVMGGVIEIKEEVVGSEETMSVKSAETAKSAVGFDFSGRAGLGRRGRGIGWKN
jgi:hypothetical protein